jgi:hypothetical protein
MWIFFVVVIFHFLNALLMTCAELPNSRNQLIAKEQGVIETVLSILQAPFDKDVNMKPKAAVSNHSMQGIFLTKLDLSNKCR